MEKKEIKIGIYKDQITKTNEFNDNFEKILDYYGYKPIRMNINDPDFWEKVKDLDLFIYRYSVFDDTKQIAETILPIIESHYKIMVIPQQNCCWQYDDKIKEYYLSMCYDLPMVQSWIFWDRKKAIAWSKTANYPLVFKLKGGASSTNVMMVKDKLEAKNLIIKMFSSGIYSNKLPLFKSTRHLDFNIKNWIRNRLRFVYKTMKRKDYNLFWQVNKNYVFFQKYLPNNKFDTRVTLLGDRAFAFRRFNRTGDFRSSGSGQKDYCSDKIDPEIIKTAFKIGSKLKFQSMAFDFLYNEEHKPEFCEMSYTFPDRTIHELPGYWDPELNFHPGQFWPQYLMLKDILNLPDECPIDL